MATGTHPGRSLFVAADVHYLASGGARAAAVVAADAAFSCLEADRIALVSDVKPYQPGRFYLRELPPLHAVLDGLAEMALLIIDGYADLDPDGRPGLGARARDEIPGASAREVRACRTRRTDQTGVVLSSRRGRASPTPSLTRFPPSGSGDRRRPSSAFVR